MPKALVVAPPAAGDGVAAAAAPPAPTLLSRLLLRDAPHTLPLAPRALVLLALAAHLARGLLDPALLDARDRAQLLGAALLLLVVYLAGRSLLRPPAAGGAEAERRFRKRRAWLILLPTAALSTGVAAVLAPQLLLGQLRAGADAGAARASFRALVETDSWGARPVTLLLWAEFVIDLMLGTLEYPEHLPPLTWVHHCVYILVCEWLLRWRTTGAFATFLLNEAPIVLLALGSIVPEARMDLPFGVLYFLTRICLSGYLSYLHFVYDEDPFIWRFMVPVMVLHSFLFFEWVVSYRKRLREQQQKGKGE